MRKVFDQADDLNVVAEYDCGQDLLDALGRGLRFDLITMDVIMPGISGIETSRSVMQLAPIPIIIMSSLTNKHSHLAFEAIEAGALDIIQKPDSALLADPDDVATLVRHLRTLAGIPLVTRNRTTKPAEWAVDSRKPDIVCIGASTGGPPIVARILADADPVRVPVIVVQHLMDGFDTGFASWLGTECRSSVNLLGDGYQDLRNEIYVVPNGFQIRCSGMQIGIEEDADSVFAPSVDRTVAALVDSRFAHRVGLIVLTGMGTDGADGAGRLSSVGGQIVVQDPTTCVCAGMPSAVVSQVPGASTLDLNGLDGVAREWLNAT